MTAKPHPGFTDTAADLDALIEEITVDAYGAGEQMWAFRQVLEDELRLPADAHVIGVPVSVVEIDFEGDERVGLRARCHREDGTEYTVSATDVVFSEHSVGARHVAAYRKWLGLAPWLPTAALAGWKRPRKATDEDVDLGGSVQLVALAVKEGAVACRISGSDRAITLRAAGLWDVVPGEIVTVSPRKMWRFGGHPYLAGDVEETRLDVAALGLVPLRLEDEGVWDPAEEYWGEEGEPIEKWARPIIARGPRPAFEMEQVIPGEDPEDYDFDPIIESNELKQAGDSSGARKILMELCQADLRCLDAHAHLGNLILPHAPEHAMRHYEVGVRIGGLSLGEHLDGVLPWGLVDNRPFLRCMHGYGLSLWRLARFDEAGRIFDRMLWLDPSDNQGARFLIDPVAAREPWEEE